MRAVCCSLCLASEVRVRIYGALRRTVNNATSRVHKRPGPWFVTSNSTDIQENTWNLQSKRDRCLSRPQPSISNLNTTRQKQNIRAARTKQPKLLLCCSIYPAPDFVARSFLYLLMLSSSMIVLRAFYFRISVSQLCTTFNNSQSSSFLCAVLPCASTYKHMITQTDVSEEIQAMQSNKTSRRHHDNTRAQNDATRKQAKSNGNTLRWTTVERTRT